MSPEEYLASIQERANNRDFSSEGVRDWFRSYTEQMQQTQRARQEQKLSLVAAKEQAAEQRFAEQESAILRAQQEAAVKQARTENPNDPNNPRVFFHSPGFKNSSYKKQRELAEQWANTFGATYYDSKWVENFRKNPDPFIGISEPKSTIGEDVVGNLAALGSAMTGAGKSVVDLFETYSDISKSLAERQDTLRGMYSDEQKERIKQLNEQSQKYEDEGSFLGQALTSAERLLTTGPGAMELIGSTAAAVVPGSIVGRLSQGAALAKGATAAAAAAKGTKAATTAITATGAAINAGSVKGGIVDAVKAASDAELMGDPSYALMRKSGLSEKQAKEQFGKEQSEYMNSPLAILAGAISGALAARLGSVEGAAAGSGGGGFVRGAGREILTEAPQSATEVLATNLGASDAIPATRGLAEAVGAAVAGGAALGGPAGLVQSRADRLAAQQQKPPAQTPPRQTQPSATSVEIDNARKVVTEYEATRNPDLADDYEAALTMLEAAGVNIVGQTTVATVSDKDTTVTITPEIQDAINIIDEQATGQSPQDDALWNAATETLTNAGIDVDAFLTDRTIRRGPATVPPAAADVVAGTGGGVADVGTGQVTVGDRAGKGSGQSVTGATSDNTGAIPVGTQRTRPLNEQTTKQPVAGTGVDGQPASNVAVDGQVTQEAPIDVQSLVGQVVDYQGNVGILARTGNGYFVNGQIVESGMSGQPAQALGIMPVPQDRADAFVAGQSLGRIAPELQQPQAAPVETDLDIERDILLMEFEELIGVDETNRIIDLALEQLGGGANFQQQLNAVKGALYGYLEQATTPTSGVEQAGGTAAQGGAGEGAPVAGAGQSASQTEVTQGAQNEEVQRQEATEEVKPSKPPKKSKKPNDNKSKVSKGTALRRASWERNPFRAFLASHGVSLQLANDFAPGVAERRSAMVSGYKPMFRRSGKNIDMLAEAAVEEGFLLEEDANELYDMISRVFSGERIVPLYAEGVAEQEMEERIRKMQGEPPEFDDFVSQERAAPSDDDWSILTPEELAETGYTQYNEQAQEEIRALVQMADSIGIDAESIIQDVAYQQIGNTQDEYEQAAKEALEEAIQGSDRGSVEDSSQEGNEPKILARPDQEEVLAQQDRASTAVELDQREQVRRESEAGAGTFELAREDGRVDSTGDMFSQPAPVVEPTPATTVVEPESAAQQTQNAPLSIGVTPSSTESVTVKDGVVYVGKYPAQNFDTGEDVTVPAGATNDQIKKAITDAGAVGARQKFFNKDGTDVKFSEGSAQEDEAKQDLSDKLDSFDSAVEAINSEAQNDAQKEIASLLKSRVAELKKLGFEFSLKVTQPGYSLNSGARGMSVITYSGLGEPTKVSITLNNKTNGDQAGTTWVTVAHEISHAVTQAQINFAPAGTAAKQLNSLFNDVVSYFNQRAKSGSMTEFEKKIYSRNNNALAAPDELLAWGLTSKEMQEWLDSIPSKNGTFLSRLFDVVASVLGLKRNDTALAELLSISENLLTEVADSYVEAANKAGKSFGLQKNTTGIPSWALSLADGRAVAWSDKDAALVKARSISGGDIYLLATPNGITRVDVGTYTGNMLPPERLAAVRKIAEDLKNNVPDQKTLFEVNSNSITGNTADKVNATLKEEGLDRNNIKVVQSVDQVSDGSKSVDINGVQGFYKQSTGEVTLVADKIPEGREAGVALHEIFHRAEEAALTLDQRTELTKQVERWKVRDKKTKERQIYDAAKRRAEKSGDESGEFLAYAIEEARNMGIQPNAKKDVGSAEGWLAKVKKFFTDALKKLAPDYKGDLTANDLVDIAYGVAARDAEIQAEGGGSVSGGDIRFSLAPQQARQNVEGRIREREEKKPRPLATRTGETIAEWFVDYKIKARNLIAEAGVKYPELSAIGDRLQNAMTTARNQGNAVIEVLSRDVITPLEQNIKNIARSVGVDADTLRIYSGEYAAARHSYDESVKRQDALLNDLQSAEIEEMIAKDLTVLARGEKANIAETVERIRAMENRMLKAMNEDRDFTLSKTTINRHVTELSEIVDRLSEVVTAASKDGKDRTLTNANIRKVNNAMLRLMADAVRIGDPYLMLDAARKYTDAVNGMANLPKAKEQLSKAKEKLSEWQKAQSTPIRIDKDKQDIATEIEIPGGMTMAEAKAIMDMRGQQGGVVEAADAMVQAYKDINSEAVRSGIITAEKKAELEAEFPNYVSMSGDKNASADDDFMFSRGRNFIDKAQGRKNFMGQQDAFNNVIAKSQQLGNKVAAQALARPAYDYMIAESQVVPETERLFDKAKVPGENTMKVYSAGQTQYFKGKNEDMRFGMGELTNARFELPKALSSATRGYGSLVTQYIMAFAPFAAIKDIGTRAFNIVQLRNMRKADGSKYTVGDVYSIRASMLTSFMSPSTWGDSVKYASTKQTSPDMESLIRNGGKMSFSDMLNSEATVSKAFKKKFPKVGKLMDVVTAYNQKFETAVILSAYKGLRANGMSEKDAAAFVVSQMNFGAKGTLTDAYLKPFYAFANPVMQDAMQVKRSLYNNGKPNYQGIAELAALAAISALLYSMLRDASDDPEEFDEKPMMEVASNWILPNGARVPVPFGMIQLANVIGVAKARMDQGLLTARGASAEIATAWFKAFSPVGSSEISASKDFAAFMTATLFPTLGKPVVLAAMDKTPYGQKLTANERADTYRSEQGKRNTPEFYKQKARELREFTGVVDMTPETAKSFFEGYAIGPLRGVLDIFVDPIGDREMKGGDTSAMFSPLAKALGVNRLISRPNDARKTYGQFSRAESDFEALSRKFNVKVSKTANTEKRAEKLNRWEEAGATDAELKFLDAYLEYENVTRTENREMTNIYKSGVLSDVPELQEAAREELADREASKIGIMQEVIEFHKAMKAAK